MLKTYWFEIKTDCKGNSHSSTTANIIWPAVATRNKPQVIAYVLSRVLAKSYLPILICLRFLLCLRPHRAEALSDAFV